MDITFEPLHPHFVARVHGVDLSGPLSDGAVETLQRAMGKFAVLVFNAQPITDDEHARFAHYFGSIDPGLLLATKRKSRLKNTEVIDLANVDANGNVLAADNSRNVSLIANQLWHSDSSFKDPSAKYSILCGVDLPGTGGETEFADQRAAYDALSPHLQGEIEGLVAEHSAFHSRDMLGGGDFSAQGREALPPVHWHIVHTVPDSGRKSLFIGIHTREISGMPTAQARMLLWDLLEHATQREFVYRHEWQNGDVLMWDNQCTLHRGRPYDLTAKRELRRCSTEVVGLAAHGDVASETLNEPELVMSGKSP